MSLEFTHVNTEDPVDTNSHMEIHGVPDYDRLRSLIGTGSSQAKQELLDEDIRMKELVKMLKTIGSYDTRSERRVDTYLDFIVMLMGGDVTKDRDTAVDVLLASFIAADRIPEATVAGIARTVQLSNTTWTTTAGTTDSNRQLRELIIERTMQEVFKGRVDQFSQTFTKSKSTQSALTDAIRSSWAGHPLLGMVPIPSDILVNMLYKMIRHSLRTVLRTQPSLRYIKMGTKEDSGVQSPKRIPMYRLKRIVDAVKVDYKTATDLLALYEVVFSILDGVNEQLEGSGYEIVVDTPNAGMLGEISFGKLKSIFNDTPDDNTFEDIPTAKSGGTPAPEKLTLAVIGANINPETSWKKLTEEANQTGQTIASIVARKQGRHYSWYNIYAKDDPLGVRLDSAIPTVKRNEEKQVKEEKMGTGPSLLDKKRIGTKSLPISSNTPESESLPVFTVNTMSGTVIMSAADRSLYKSIVKKTSGLGLRTPDSRSRYFELLNDSITVAVVRMNDVTTVPIDILDRLCRLMVAYKYEIGKPNTEWLDKLKSPLGGKNNKIHDDLVDAVTEEEARALSASIVRGCSAMFDL